MQSEKELDRVLFNSLKPGYKIADPSFAGGSAGELNKRPFDGFGVYEGRVAFIEGKFLPEPKAFNWSRLEDHQLEWLKAFNLPGCITCVIIGVQFKRGDIRCFPYTIDECEYRKINKISVTKKEFTEDPLYVKIEKGKIDYSRIIEILDEKSRKTAWKL